MPGKGHLLPVEQLADMHFDDYVPTELSGPILHGSSLKVFAWLVESRLFGSMLLSKIKHMNNIPQALSWTGIPEGPMFLPEFPSENKEENSVITFDQDTDPSTRLASALCCLQALETEATYPFRYWSIRDYAQAYTTGRVTPSEVANHFIQACKKSQEGTPPMCFFIDTDENDIRKQAAASSQRFYKERPLSVLDGILIAVKDEIDCLPYPTRDLDSLCVARLRKCGVIFVGKTNMNELGLGVNGSNPHYGVVRNPYNVNCYSGGSAAGSIAVVSAGLCPAALGTDGGGSIRIPASLCGVVGLKTTFGRTSSVGVVPLGWTLEVVSPAAATVEDAMLVYAGMLGSHPQDVLVSPPLPPALPMLEGALNSHEFKSLIGALKIGKYTAWFNHVTNPDITKVCGETLKLLCSTYGTEIKEVVLPELDELRIGHLVTLGSEMSNAINADYENGYKKELCYEARGTLALFRTFSAAEYIAAQRLRRRIMYHHMQAFKAVDILVTPTTGMTAPPIPEKAVKDGESNLEVTGSLMRFLPAANFIGLPAISVPVGYDAQGLPIGIQLISRPWSEATLLRLASAIEKACLPRRRKPSVFFDILKEGAK